jgi:phage terminase small subunit
MPKRRIDPTTGDPNLTYREERFLDEFVSNGGNASRAAVSAGYSAARADQSAYQILRRPEIQRRIAQRIAESRVIADEIIGTLASLMRGTLADFLDESGDFSMDLAIQRGVDHQLKNITSTTREIKATKDKPAQVIRTTRASLHSPIQAARALAHILGIDRHPARSRQPSADHRPLTTAQRPLTTPHHRPPSTDFDPLVWLDDIISDQMRQTGLSRDQVIANLIQLRPEIAKYVIELEKAQTPNPYEHLTLRQISKELGRTIDELVAVRRTGAPDQEDTGAITRHQLSNAYPEPDFRAASESAPDTAPPPPPVIDRDLPGAARFQRAPAVKLDIPPLQASDTPDEPQVRPSTSMAIPVQPSDNGPFTSAPAPTAVRSTTTAPDTTTSEAQSDYTPFDPTFHSTFSELSDREGDALARLRFRDLIQEWVDTRNLTEAQAIDAIRDRAASDTFVFDRIIHVCIREYKRMRAAGLIQDPVPTQHRQPQPNQKSNFITASPPLPENSIFTNVLCPRSYAPDQGLSSIDFGFADGVSTSETRVPP